MALSILNNIASLAAENELNVTNNSLQNTLFQLSSGQRINSGADDAAGLAIANGLQANITALTQSSQNATDGIGMLQVADGAMSQVTSLLNRAVTLATESASSTVTDSQRQAVDAEYQSIKAEITSIGQNTTYNGTGLFGTGSSNSNPNVWQGATTGLNAGTALSTGDNLTITDTDTGKTATYTFTTGDTMQQLMNYFNTGAGSSKVNAQVSINSTGQLEVDDPNGNGSLVVSGTVTEAGSIAREADTGENIFLSDGTSTGNSAISFSIGTLSASSIGFSSGLTPVDLSSTSLATQSGAQSALTSLTSAIANVASDRGNLGAVTNRLQAASNVISSQVQNLTSAESGIMSADIPTTVANMTKYEILEQTGMSALAQANQMQQNVLKLLQ